MAHSGIQLDSEVKPLVEKITRHNSKHRYAIFKINDDKTKVMVEKIGDRTDDDKWEDFCNEFEDGECKLAVYNVPISSKETASTKDVILGIAWNGPQSEVKAKMIHSTTVHLFKSILSNAKTAEIDCREELQNITEILADKYPTDKYAGN